MKEAPSPLMQRHPPCTGAANITVVSGFSPRSPQARSSRMIERMTSMPVQPVHPRGARQGVTATVLTSGSKNTGGPSVIPVSHASVRNMSPEQMRQVVGGLGGRAVGPAYSPPAPRSPPMISKTSASYVAAAPPTTSSASAATGLRKGSYVAAAPTGKGLGPFYRAQSGSLPGATSPTSNSGATGPVAMVSAPLTTGGVRATVATAASQQQQQQQQQQYLQRPQLATGGIDNLSTSATAAALWQQQQQQQQGYPQGQQKTVMVTTSTGQDKDSLAKTYRIAHVGGHQGQASASAAESASATSSTQAAAPAAPAAPSATAPSPSPQLRVPPHGAQSQMPQRMSSPQSTNQALPVGGGCGGSTATGAASAASGGPHTVVMSRGQTSPRVVFATSTTSPRSTRPGLQPTSGPTLVALGGGCCGHPTGSNATNAGSVSGSAAMGSTGSGNVLVGGGGASSAAGAGSAAAAASASASASGCGVGGGCGSGSCAAAPAVQAAVQVASAAGGDMAGGPAVSGPASTVYSNSNAGLGAANNSSSNQNNLTTETTADLDNTRRGGGGGVVPPLQLSQMQIPRQPSAMWAGRPAAGLTLTPRAWANSQDVLDVSSLNSQGGINGEGQIQDIELMRRIALIEAKVIDRESLLEKLSQQQAQLDRLETLAKENEQLRTQLKVAVEATPSRGKGSLHSAATSTSTTATTAAERGGGGATSSSSHPIATATMASTATSASLSSQGQAPSGMKEPSLRSPRTSSAWKTAQALNAAGLERRRAGGSSNNNNGSSSNNSGSNVVGATSTSSNAAAPPPTASPVKAAGAPNGNSHSHTHGGNNTNVSNCSNNNNNSSHSVHVGAAHSAAATALPAESLSSGPGARRMTSAGAQFSVMSNSQSVTRPAGSRSPRGGPMLPRAELETCLGELELALGLPLGGPESGAGPRRRSPGRSQDQDQRPHMQQQHHHQQHQQLQQQQLQQQQQQQQQLQQQQLQQQLQQRQHQPPPSPGPSQVRHL